MYSLIINTYVFRFIGIILKFLFLTGHKHGLPLVDSDGESISQPFPPVPNTDSDLGNLRLSLL